MLVTSLPILSALKLKNLWTNSRTSSTVYFLSTATANIAGAFFLGDGSYGKISLFIAQAGLVSSFVSLRQELIIPASDKKAEATLSPIIISIFIGSALTFSKHYLSVGFDHWAVITGMLLAINNALQTFYASTANFIWLTYARIKLTLLPMICLVILNKFWPLSNTSELSSAYTYFLLIFTLPLVILLFSGIGQNLGNAFLNIRPRKVGLLAIPADITNANTQLLPISAIAASFGPAVAGNYALAVKILSIPVSIFTRLFIDDVIRYVGPSADSLAKRHSLWRTYKSISRPIIAFALCIQIVYLFLFNNTFTTPPSVNILIILSIALLPAYLLKAIGSPVSYLLYLWGGAHYDLTFQLLFYGLMLIACNINSSFSALIAAVSVATFISYYVYYTSTFFFISRYEARNS